MNGGTGRGGFRGGATNRGAGRGGFRGVAMHRGGKTRAQPSASASNKEDDRKARHKKDLKDRLTIVYEDEGIEYGDVSTDDDSRSKVSHLFWIFSPRFINIFQGFILQTAVELRIKRINQVFQEIRRARNVELCFLVDITGSMQSHIDGVRTSIMQIVQNLTSSQVGAQGVAQEMKLAFVGYRDCGERNQFEMLQFGSSPS